MQGLKKKEGDFNGVPAMVDCVEITILYIATCFFIIIICD